MRVSKHGWGHDEVCAMLKGFGFRVAERAKHTICEHGDYPDLTLGVPRHKVLREWVSRDAVKLVDQLRERERHDHD